MPPDLVRVIVDTDPGIDDALALLHLAGRPGVRVEALGIVHGNVPVTTCARNALRILEVVGLTGVPVAVGAARPLAQPPSTAEFVHGDDGLGDTAQPAPSGTVSGEAAAVQLVRLARENPGELSLLAIGPLTNVALALLLEPELPRLLGRVVVMGGALAEPGNITAHAEANIGNDPEAAALVLSAGFDLGLVPLDVTHATLLRGDDLGRLEAATTEPARFAWSVLQFYLDAYERRVGERACPLHDPLAAALLVEPALARWDSHVVEVELRGEHTRGATLVDHRWGGDAPGAAGSVEVALGVDRDAAVDGLLATLGA